MRVARSLLVLSGIAAIPAGLTLGRPVRVMLPPPERITTQETIADTAPSWDSLSTFLVFRDPFRADRAPSPVGFSLDPVDPSYAPPAPPKPVLLLTGIVWGAEPSAIIEGVPGLEGSRLMRQGDVAGGIKIRRITTSQVFLSGMDTTWTLSVRRPW